MNKKNLSHSLQVKIAIIIYTSYYTIAKCKKIPINPYFLIKMHLSHLKSGLLRDNANLGEADIGALQPNDLEFGNWPHARLSCLF